jgi:DNA excision repair protein ERCC-3
MSHSPDNPLIIQSDRTVLAEVDSPNYPAARDSLARFAELEKSPEHIHTYRITPLSLWNAASAGMSPEEIIDGMTHWAKYEVPRAVIADVREFSTRYGRLKLTRDGVDLMLTADTPVLMTEMCSNKDATKFLDRQVGPTSVVVSPDRRGHIKQALIKIGYPVEDLAGYVTGDPLPFSVRPQTTLGQPFALRDYQIEAAALFDVGGSADGGSGVVVLPCGAGKTVVGMAVMERLSTHTLIMTTSITAVRQWRRELLEKSTLTEDQIGEYSGEEKNIRPVTITTYQMLTYRPKKTEKFPHFGIFTSMNWGLILYDEVHLLPAPVFRVTAEIQARRRLGLTATLVREDGNEADVFSLIGPKRYDVPWKVLERQGWIAPAVCTEVRIPMPEEGELPYAVADGRRKVRLAAENPGKHHVLKALLERHADDQVLIIGQYLDQVADVAKRIGAPLITGRTANSVRQELYDQFRGGDLNTLVVSKVGNFAIDLPDANVLIQVSGTFGSRQEEAQRLGRILRPKADGGQASFYSLVTQHTREQEFAMNRQLFLAEQGYRYSIVDASEIAG